MGVSFFDNTDPDGIDYVLKTLGSRLAQTLVIVISKSGGTAETRNGMLEARSPSRPPASTIRSISSPSPASARSSTRSPS
jgi:glucosamine 6-phosphate synthetase-like amidotransferase/phosphosugar isomerase protein